MKKLAKWFENIAVWCAVGIGFSIPISTALDNILLYFVLIFGVLSGVFWKHRAHISGNPVALAAWLLTGLLIIGGFYGLGSAEDALNYFGKYIDIMFIPLFFVIFSDARYRSYGLLGFMAAMLVTLVFSYLIMFHVFEHTRYFVTSTPNDPHAFKGYIAQGILMAVAAYFCIVKAKYSQGRMRLVWMALALLGAFDVLAMPARTAYLVLVVLGVYFAYSQVLKGRLLPTALGGIVLALALYGLVPDVRSRVDLGVHEIQGWQSQHVARNSMSDRMNFYTTTLKIIKDNPVFGVGTGGFEKAYGREIAASGLPLSNNPHNQYLLLTAQLGLVGLAVLIYLFYTQWRATKYLPTEEERLMARGIVLAIATGCLVNSLLLDHTEGLFYAWASGLLFASYRSPATNGAAGG